MIIECACARGTYNSEKFESCYQCYLDRQDTLTQCVFCSRWHTPKYAMCFTCRQERGPSGDDTANALRMDTLLRDGFACYGCGSHDTPQVTHLRPVPRGGTADVWNLATACKTCIKNRDEHTAAARRYQLMCTYLTYGWAWLDGEQRIMLCDQALAESDQRRDFSRFVHFREFLSATIDPPQWAVELADVYTPEMIVTRTGK